MIENLEGEIWKDIPNQNGVYQVSNMGRVKTIGRSYTDCLGITRFKQGALIKGGFCKKGYRRISLPINGLRKTMAVHRLVLMAFDRMPLGEEVCMHMNDKKNDNRLENLKWGSEQENRQQAVDRGLLKGKNNFTGRFGENNPMSIRIAMYDLDNNWICNFISVTEAWKHTNISPSAIAKSSKLGVKIRGYKVVFRRIESQAA